MYTVGQAPTHTNGNPAFPTMNTSAHASGNNMILPPHAYTVSPATQVWNGPQGIPVTVVPQNSSPAFHRTFLKAKPRALGIVLIVAAVLQIALGIGQICTFFAVSTVSGIVFWGSVFYIIAGALTVAAYCKPNICLVKGSLSLNIISSVFSFIAFILNCVDLALAPFFDYSYYYNNNSYEESYDTGYYRERHYRGYAILSILLLTNLLLFCVSLSVSIFGCRSLAQETPNVPQVFIIQNDVVLSMSPSTAPGTFPAFAQSGSPPQYTAQQDKAY
ncbi:membrane-spanning 4-domains subfamily A member 4A-like [Pseudophryne corroboree]|uniref:membrane-spanning 4-domains subfamily A member 4A-like n=1 Tax=Pseudophryne corroboree TaxID=495146 RepID=UPI0030814144